MRNTALFRKTVLTGAMLPAMLSALSFQSPPVLSRAAGGDGTVSFTLDSAADVEVAVVNLDDSSIVRHLAAGVLGPNPPAPLQASSLTQQVAWDGKDDLGNAVPLTARLAARVRAGMRVRLASVLGDNPYRYLVAVYGLALDPAGNLYVLGQYGHLNLESDHGASVLNALRKYGPDGTYQRTLFPQPAGTPLNQASPYGVVTLAGTGWRYTTTTLDGPKLGDPNAAITGMGAILTSEFRNGQLLIVNRPYQGTKGGPAANNKLNWMTLDTLGNMTVASPLSFISSPPLPAKSMYYGPWYGGPLFITPSPDGRYYLVSGYYQVDTSYFGTASAFVPTDTGIWRDGQIFKVDRNTGVAVSWLALDSVPRLPSERSAKVGPGPVLANVMGNHMSMFGCIHGTAMDDSGHVFVCDRLHQRVSVYDTNATLLGFIPVDNPDLVIVARKTGALYVFSRNINSYSSSTGWLRYVTLRKFPGWRNNPSPSITLANYPLKPWGKFYAVLNEVPAQPLLWVTSFGSGYDNRNPQLYGTAADTQNGIWALRDDGDKFTVVKSFSGDSKGAVRGFDRLAVDRRSERLYVNDSWHGLYKIEDWSRPVFVRCSTAAGKCLDGIDAAVGWDGFLYTREGDCCSWNGGHYRYTQDHRHAPVNYSTGTHRLSDGLMQHEGGGAADRGHDLTRKGQIGHIKRKSNGINFAVWCPVPGDTAQDTLLSALPELSGGFKWGPDGNAYVGVLLRDPAHVVPAAWTTDWGYRNAVGAIVKLAPGAGAWVDSGSMLASSRKAHNVLGVYKTGLAPFNAGGSCVCRSPRFDVDPYGRLFIPNAITGTVAVVDNNENPILSFGEYGNTDSRGAGSLVPSPDIPLLWPTGVAASENFIYVTDMGNERLARARMEFTLDNYPGLSSSAGTLPAGLPAEALSVIPNPFTPSARIRLPSGIRFSSLRIFDAGGRMVAEWTGPEISRTVAWNGRNRDGRSLAPGIYLVAAREGKRALQTRAVLLK